MDAGSDDPYEGVELLEHALMLALRLPRFPAKPKAGKRTSTEAVELNYFLTKHNGRLRNLCKPEGHDVPVYADSMHALSPSMWIAKREHFRLRLVLLDVLWKARAKELDALRLLPEPDGRGRWTRAAPYRFGFDTPRWDALSERARQVLEALSERRLTAKELDHQLRWAKGAARKVIAPLMNSQVLRRDGKEGYAIALVPLGSPAQIKSAP